MPLAAAPVRFASHGLALRRSFPVAQEDLILETSPLDDEKNQQRIFEICNLDQNGEIDECNVIYEEDLPESVGLEKAAQIINDPQESNLFFDMPSESEEESRLLTFAEWRVCFEEDICKVPEDVLLKGMGPDALEELQSASEQQSASGSESSIPSEDVGADSRYHLHFGAGRLGMGLVVPAISASGVPFAVVQRPKPKWEELFRQEGVQSEANEIAISVNKSVVVHNVEIVRDTSTPPSLVPPKALIFGSTAKDIEYAIERATSFSCSLGSAMSRVLVPMLASLPRDQKPEDQPCLFCCENDHDAVKKLRDELRGVVRVVDCMVDRVCTGRTISAEGVEVAAEEWKGSIVVLEPNVTGRLPFSATIATLPSSEEEAEYLSDRKLALVNGMHTTLAFMTLQDEFDLEEEGCEYILLKYTKLPRERQRMVEAWRTCRVAQLLERYGVDNLQLWHDVESEEAVWEELLTFADHVLVERFSTMDDVVSRVLGGGVANRWLTRLRPSYDWCVKRPSPTAAHKASPSWHPLASKRSGESPSDDLSRFFRYALERDRERALERGCSLEDAEWRGCAVEEPLEEGADPTAVIVDYVEGLTMAARVFCSREREITHKHLIKKQRLAGGYVKAPETKKAMAAQKGRGI